MAKRYFNFDLLGDGQLEKALLQLPKAASKQVLRNSLKAAALPVAVEAARRAPRGQEGGPHLADSITVSTKLTRRQRTSRVKAGAVEVFVGPRARHAHLVEFGTGPRYHKSGKYVGQMPAQPFMRPAWDSRRRLALEILKRQIWKEIAKTAKRLRRQAQRIDNRISRGYRKGR